MAMQQCPNGHLYDDARSSTCPFCNSGNSLNRTVPLNEPPLGQGYGAARPSFPSTEPLDNGFQSPQPGIVGGQGVSPTEPIDTKDMQTMYVESMVNEKGIIDVRGWVVCLEGEKRGVDFQLYGGKNSIGRGSENDIQLDFDSTISKGVNAIIQYDDKNNRFWLNPGNSKNNMYINNELLLTAVELKDYDVMEIGETKLIFRSLCNEQFNWSKASE